MFIAIVSGPWAEFKYVTKAIEKMYYVKTRRRDLFRESAAPKHIEELAKAHDAASSVSKNGAPYHIRLGKLSACQSFTLFLREYIFFCFTCADDPRQVSDLTQRWYRMGQERLEEELDIVGIVRNLRDLRILTKEVREQDNTQMKLRVLDDNLLRLDSDEEEHKPKKLREADIFPDSDIDVDNSNINILE